MKTMKKFGILLLTVLIFACNSDDNVADTTAPVVTLIGEPKIYVLNGSTYVDEGATATDDVDGDLTSNIVTTSNVDTSQESGAFHTVTHTVRDNAGNMHSASRTIVVDNTRCWNGTVTASTAKFFTMNCLQNGQNYTYSIVPCKKTIDKFNSQGGDVATNTGVFGKITMCDGTFYEDVRGEGAMLPIGGLNGFATVIQNINDVLNPTYRPLFGITTSYYTNMHRLFQNFSNEFDDSIQAMQYWDVSNVTDMSNMFQGAQFSADLTKWDVSNVTDMNSMFKDTRNFNHDLHLWDVGKAIDCANFNDGATEWTLPKPWLKASCLSN